MTPQLLTRIAIASVLALGSLSAMAGTRYIFVQPSAAATCSGTECQTLQAAIQVAPAGASTAPDTSNQAPTEEDIYQANMHITQLWQILFAQATTGHPPEAARAAVLEDGYTPFMSLYTVSVQDANTLVSQVVNGQNQVIGETRKARASGSRSGVPAKACEVIAAKGFADISCAGGTITAQVHFNVSSQIDPTTGYRTPGTTPPVWFTTDPAVLASIYGFGYPGYFPSAPV